MSIEKYCETVSLCPHCGIDCPALYEFRADGVHLLADCPVHGSSEERVESDAAFFRAGYECDYRPPVAHLAFPLTYRCNLACRYCYTLSNAGSGRVPDRSLERIMELFGKTSGNVTLIGGEPTVRNDLPEIISAMKSAGPGRRISVASNGQKLADLAALERLRAAGMDFLFLSVNDPAYEVSEQTLANKLAALENCRRLGVPVWLQRTVDGLEQLDSLPALIERFNRVIFRVTIRAVKSFGAEYPKGQVFVSDMLGCLGWSGRDCRGTTPFNRHIRLQGKPVKLCSWINDVRRIDPLDSAYIISNDEITKFHRGMKQDELLLNRLVGSHHLSR